MARKPASRKYQITINNPLEHDFSHENIKKRFAFFPGLIYWGMCDEVGAEGTPHTHLYLLFQNAVMFDTLHKAFYGAHIEAAQGSNQANYEYIRKAGKWADDEKSETNLPDTFEESGALPTERAKGQTDSEAILTMLQQGASEYDVLQAFPSSMNKIDKINQTRQILLREKSKNEFRNLDVTYLWGATGTGKARSIMERYQYENVYRVTNYAHPFDGYQGESVILFEEFRSSLPLTEMLIYLDGYPTKLPCRYADRVACYKTVFIATNIPLEKQYPQLQQEAPETWQAFLRRIHHVIQFPATDENEFTPLPEGADCPFTSL
ncbi:MAG: replication protein [Ruthenibacterium sp.]